MKDPFITKGEFYDGSGLEIVKNYYKISIICNVTFSL